MNLNQQITSDKPWTLIKGYLSSAQQQTLYSEVENYPYERPQITVFGKQHYIPRQQVWFGDLGCSYQYANLRVKPQPWPTQLSILRQALVTDFDLTSNGVLVNRYADGKNSMGWHSDNEPELVDGSDIASISLGAGRDFLLRRKSCNRQYSLHLESGDLLIMHYPMQKHWQHALPKRLKQTQVRWNFTFRQITPYFYQDKPQKV